MDNIIYKGFLIKFWDDEWWDSPRDGINLWHLCLKANRYNLPWETNISKTNATYRTRERAYDGTFVSVENDVYSLTDLALAIRQDVESEGDAIAAIVPVFMLDHSGVAFHRGHTDPFGHLYHGMDSGCVGWAYVTRNTLLHWYQEHKELIAFFGRKRLTDSMIAQAYKILDAELKEYTSYVNNFDMYGYTLYRLAYTAAEVEDPDDLVEGIDYDPDDHVESVGGFYAADAQGEKYLVETTKKTIDNIIRTAPVKAGQLLLNLEV